MTLSGILFFLFICLPILNFGHIIYGWLKRKITAAQGVIIIFITFLTPVFLAFALPGAIVPFGRGGSSEFNFLGIAVGSILVQLICLAFLFNRTNSPDEKQIEDSGILDNNP